MSGGVQTGPPTSVATPVNRTRANSLSFHNHASPRHPAPSPVPPPPAPSGPPMGRGRTEEPLRRLSACAVLPSIPSNDQFVIDHFVNLELGRMNNQSGKMKDPSGADSAHLQVTHPSLPPILQHNISPALREVGATGVKLSSASQTNHHDKHLIHCNTLLCTVLAAG